MILITVAVLLDEVYVRMPDMGREILYDDV